MMQRCDVVVEEDKLTPTIKSLDFITDLDVNDDSLLEVIIYSSTQTSLFWMKQYEPFISGFGWNSKFWIYIVLYVYTVSSIVGIYEFYKLKKLNDKYSKEKLLKEEVMAGNASNSENQIELKV